MRKVVEIVRKRKADTKKIGGKRTRREIRQTTRHGKTDRGHFCGRLI